MSVADEAQIQCGHGCGVGQQLQLRFNPWPGKFHMLQVAAIKRKKNEDICLFHYIDFALMLQKKREIEKKKKNCWRSSLVAQQVKDLCCHCCGLGSVRGLGNSSCCVHGQKQQQQQQNQTAGALVHCKAVISIV